VLKVVDKLHILMDVNENTKLEEISTISDQTEWFNHLWNDRGNPNGNKFRTYRQHKKDKFAEHYIIQLIPRGYRSIPAK